jgi:hypothetical protein
MRTPVVRQVTKARLEAQGLSFDSLHTMAFPVLSWCGEYLKKLPGENKVPALFRSQALQEAANKVFPFSCHTQFSQSLLEAFDHFLLVRQKMNPKPKVSSEEVLEELRRPRSLLLTDWSASLFDGALAPETLGFINDDCMPPWDTWMALVQVGGSHGLVCLLSWVPVWLSEKVDFAIRVDAAKCLSWLVIQDHDKMFANGWGESWKDNGDA